MQGIVSCMKMAMLKSCNEPLHSLDVLLCLCVQESATQSRTALVLNLHSSLKLCAVTRNLGCPSGARATRLVPTASGQ